MGVYINMEMPTAHVLFCIHPDGKVFADLEGGWREYKAIPVPPHGRLIDADALRAEFQEPNEENGGWRNPDEALVHKTGVWAAIDTAPTIIPADPAEEGE